MKKHFLKFKKVYINIACSPLLFVSNNSELVASYLPNDVEKAITKLEINNIYNGEFHIKQIEQNKKFLIAENKNNINQESVLVSEIIIEGWENHPEGRKLELAAYDSMSIKPGSIIDILFCNSLRLRVVP